MLFCEIIFEFYDLKFSKNNTLEHAQEFYMNERLLCFSLVNDDNSKDLVLNLIL